MSKEPAGTMQIRIGGPIIPLLENWRRAQPVIPSRAEAVRTLIERGLGVVNNPVHKPGEIHSAPGQQSPNLPLSTATLQQTDNLNSVVEASVNTGNFGGKEPSGLKVRVVQREQDKAHQELFATGIVTLCDLAGLDESVAHDKVATWLITTNQDAVFVLGLITAAKEMGLDTGAVVPLLNREVGKHRPLELPAGENSD